MNAGHVAVIDIGKTNAKLVLVNAVDLSELDIVTTPNTVIDAKPWPHYDTEAIWTFLIDGLRTFHALHGIDVISITTHGACAALIAADGTLAAPILDYEFDLDDTAAEYDRIRPAFNETGSPRLPGGLNIGAQIHWQFSADPALLARTQHIVTYPQYWGHRLTGIAATDVSSLGCHTDLWNPTERRFSSLVNTLEITDKIAPVRKPNDVLGSLLPEIANLTGLDANTPVLCGIHDSNASLLPYILQHTPPFSVVSTGTWVIAMSIGGSQVTLDPNKDTLINVNAMGEPVASARFMGGREYELATEKPYPEPTEDILAVVLKEKFMLLPAVVPNTGPYQGRQSSWRQNNEPPVGSMQRGTAVALYLALVTSQCLELIGHQGSVIVEGPFSDNWVYLAMLSATTNAPVLSAVGMTGTSQGAALLSNTDRKQPVNCDQIMPQNDHISELMRKYADEWSLLVQQDSDITIG